MMESESDERVQELEEEITIVRSTKKFGRMSEVCKKLNLQSHTFGEDCRCSRLKCFENVRESFRLN